MWTCVVCASLYGQCSSVLERRISQLKSNTPVGDWFLMPYFHRPTDWNCHSTMRPIPLKSIHHPSLDYTRSVHGLCVVRRFWSSGYFNRKKNEKRNTSKWKPVSEICSFFTHLFRLKFVRTKKKCSFCFVHASFVSASCFNIETWDHNRLKKKLPPLRPSNSKYWPKLLIFDYNVFPTSAHTIISLWAPNHTQLYHTLSKGGVEEWIIFGSPHCQHRTLNQNGYWIHCVSEFLLEIRSKCRSVMSIGACNGRLI